MSAAPPLRILVVENHRDTLEYLRMFLEQLGHAATVTDTLKAGLDALKGQTWDVLISNIGLPDGTGWDLLIQGRERRPPIRIAISGFGMHSDVARSKAAGFQHHLIKPFPPEALAALLVPEESNTI